jgi:hypothetical protein
MRRNDTVSFFRLFYELKLFKDRTFLKPVLLPPSGKDARPSSEMFFLNILENGQNPKKLRIVKLHVSILYTDHHLQASYKTLCET